MKCFRGILFVLSFILILVDGQTGYCQPYFDVVGISGWHIPKGSDPSVPAESYETAFISIPFNISKSSKIIISPYQENRFWNVKNESLTLRGTALPITIFHSAKDSSWSFTATFIPRFNGQDFDFGHQFFQAGGALISVFRINPTLKLKFGMYFNREFFSDYFVPLVGVDWIINSRLQLFGIVPNSLKLEYKFSKSIYAGFAYKSITTSFRANDGVGYYKLQDNHLGAYADFYFTKHIVFMAEAGHTFLRKFHNRSEKYFPNFEKDGPIFKVGIYYRIRFDN